MKHGDVSPLFGVMSHLIGYLGGMASVICSGRHGDHGFLRRHSDRNLLGRI